MVGMVLEGGGLRGVYTGGVLDFLMSEHIWFPYVVGVSAGACNATSYVSRQQGRAGRVLLDHVMNPRYLSKRNLLLHGSIFGMDFIFGDIPRRLDPFDFATFSHSNTQLELAVTNLHTGKADYYGKDAMMDEAFTLLRATSSMPLVSKVVYYNGRPYLDGAVADSIPVQRALDQGCSRLLIVLTQPRGFVKQPMSAPTARHLLYRRWPAFVAATDTRHERYNQVLALVDRLEQEGRAIVLAPKKPIPFGSFEKDLDKLHALYADGHAAAQEQAVHIRALLEMDSAPSPIAIPL